MDNEDWKALDIYTLTSAACEDIDNRFTYNAPKDDQPQRYVQIRSMARSMAFSMHSMCPPSRELSLAITKLEEAVMWANASIARNEK